MRILSKKCLTATWFAVNHKCYASINSKITAVRLCSTNPVILQSIKKKLKPYGTLLINLPFNIEIKPIDHHEYPNMDTLLITLFAKTPINKSEIDYVNISSTSDIHTIDCNNNLNSDISCVIEAPISYDIDAKTVGEGNIAISDMISKTIDIQTEYGNIIATKLQGNEISLSASEGGSITLQKSIQGDIEINTAKDGVVNAEKCLGSRLDVSTEDGDVNIGSNYCDNATFTTLNGNLLLNNLHMNTAIDIHGKGSLNITCLDGSLQANLQEGSAKIQIVRITGNSVIQSGGEIFLNVPEDIDTQLTLISGKHLDVDPQITGTFSKDGKKFISDSDNDYKLYVETDENIQVARLNWMESLKLGKRLK